MKRPLRISIASTLLLITINNVNAQRNSTKESDFPDLTGPYFGQKTPIEEAEIFLDGIISTLNAPEMCAAFTNLGKEFYYNAQYKGSWTQAKNMGPRVNSSSGEICPSVSLDGKYFFFTSKRRGKADIFWLTSDIIEDLKPEE